jgi:ribosomal protein L11 methyltransferase
MRQDNLKKTIYDLFENRHIRLTPTDLERTVCRSQPGLSPRTVRSAIKELVAEGTLSYSYHFNTTHIELNFCRPIRVSPRIVLLPYGQTCPPADDGTQTIMLLQGSAFGIGDHPTTRLALCALDRVMAVTLAGGLTSGIRALDIGTGSGVLAMAAVRLGAEKVVAVDIDRLALHEAGDNIRLNDMDRAIMLTDDALANLAGAPFDLVMANLRPPTLKQILPQVEGLSSKNSYWIISGFRQDALEEVAGILPQARTEILSREKACGWAAMTIRYIPSPH